MINQNYFSYTAPNRTNVFLILKNSNIYYWTAGENIYQAYPPATGSATAIVSSWLTSPSHRATMLNAGYARVGIDVADNSTRIVAVIVLTN